MVPNLLCCTTGCEQGHRQCHPARPRGKVKKTECGRAALSDMAEIPIRSAVGLAQV